MAEEEKGILPLPLTVFCVKYPAKHALQLKGVQGVEPPVGVLGLKAPREGGGGQPHE